MLRIRSLAIAGCALVVAACGSSASSSGAGAGGASSAVRFANCMRSHGVPSFPDPGSGGGIQINAGSGINPRSPAFLAAQRKCAGLLPGGGPLGHHASEADKLRMLAMSRCMRTHGLPSFPDPVATPPHPGTGFGLAFGAAGSIIAIPQSLLGSPAFRQAAAACGLPGGGGGKASPAPG
jgi:hypothetical protein